MTSPDSRTSRPARARRPGRTPAVQLTEEKLQTICDLVAEGVPQKAAAGSLGIPERTWKQWLEHGRREDAKEPYASIAERLGLALDTFHAARVQELHRVSKDDPKVIQWELERRFPADWADPREGGVTINLGLILQSPEWYALRDDVLEALAPFPEALAAVALKLGGGDIVEGEVVREIEE